MNAALNKGSIVWLYENYYLASGTFSGSENEQFFAARQNSPLIYRISPKGLGEGAGQSIPGGSNKQD